MQLDGSVDPYKLCKLNLFIASVSIYHFGEYFYKLSYHYYDLSIDDYQINHSIAYMVAMCLCLAEYFVKQHFREYAIVWIINDTKLADIFSWVGLVFIVVGHTFRIGSMFHAASNFNHLV